MLKSKFETTAFCAAFLALGGCSHTYDDMVARNADSFSAPQAAACAVLDVDSCSDERFSLLTPSREVIYTTRAEVVFATEDTQEGQSTDTANPSANGSTTTRKTITNENLEPTPTLGK